jgi:hypothetical protein
MVEANFRDILSDPSWFDVLTAGTVFLHRQQPVAGEVVRLARSQLTNVTFKFVSARSQDWESALPSPRARRLAPSRRSVTVFDTCSDRLASERVLDAFLATRGGRGLWMLGLPSDLRPGDAGRFDVAMYSDLPNDELELVRLGSHINKSLWKRFEDRPEVSSAVFLVLGGEELHRVPRGSEGEVLAVGESRYLPSSVSACEESDPGATRVENAPAFWVAPPASFRITR